MQKLLTTFVVFTALLAVGLAQAPAACSGNVRNGTDAALPTGCSAGTVVVPAAGSTGGAATASVCNCTTAASTHIIAANATGSTGSTAGTDSRLCLVGCVDCTPGTPADCTHCASGYGHIASDTTSPYACSACTAASRCNACDTTSPATAAVCLNCTTGNYLNSSTKVCTACGTGCADCVDGNSCKTCTQANLTWNNASQKCHGSTLKATTIFGGVLAAIVLALVF